MIIHTFGYTVFKMITHILEYGIIMMRKIYAVMFSQERRKAIYYCVIFKLKCQITAYFIIFSDIEVRQ